MAYNYNDHLPTYAEFRRLNSFNMQLISKYSRLAVNTWQDVPIRITEDDALNLSFEIPPTFYEIVFKRNDKSLFPNYVVTYQIKENNERINIFSYYFENIEITDDLKHVIHCRADVLSSYLDYYLSDLVCIKTESKPSANTKYSGQKTTFSWIGESFTRDRINYLFPYLSERDNSQSIRNILISIASNRVFDANYGQYYEKSMPIGSQFYSISANVLREISKKLSTKTFFDELKETLLGGDMKNAILTIRKYPFEIQGDANPPEFAMFIGGSDKYIDLTPELRAETRYFTNYRYVMSSDATREYVESKYYIPTVAPFTYSYSVNQVERMELHLPFVDIDLSNYIEYFEGTFSAGYIIDVYSGKGCLGITKGNKFNPKLYGTIATGSETPFDIVVPIEVGQQIEWTVTESNEVSRALSMAASAYGLMNGNVGAAFVGINHLFSDPTTITPHSATSPSGAENMSIYGLMQHYGLKAVGKSVGVENTGFMNTRQSFTSIPTQSPVTNPSNSTYNIIKVDVVKKNWTPFDNVNDEIYRCLTEVGFVKD